MKFGAQKEDEIWRLKNGSGAVERKRISLSCDKTEIQYLKTAIQNTNLHSSIAIHFFSLMSDPDDMPVLFCKNMTKSMQKYTFTIV